jgi:hypothetical protein
MLDPAVRARAALDRFLTAVATDTRLRNNPDAIANVVNGVRPWFEGFPQPDQHAIVLAVHKLTGRDMVWVRKLFGLSEMEVRRALRSRPPKLDRHGYEQVYPTSGWLGAYLLYAQDSEAPLGWHFWCAVAIIGMAARRNFYWDRGRYVLYLNHYLIMLGPTGLKKSTTIDQAVEILKLASAKAVDGQRGPGPDPFYFSADRVTPAALDADLSLWFKSHPDTKDTICAILNDEVATLLGKDVWGSDVLIHFLTAVYGGKAVWRDASIGRGKREMRNLQVSCLFGSTADWVRDSVTNEMMSGGFVGRCVMVPRDEPHGVYPEPPPADPVTKHVLAESLVPWIGYEGLCECRRSPEASAWFDSWYHDHKAKKPADPRLEGWWNRKDDHLHKLAAILRLAELIGCPPSVFEEVQNEHSLVVGEQHFREAAKILDEEQARLPKLIAMVGASADARNTEKLLAIIEEYYRVQKVAIPHSMALRKAAHFLGDAWHLDRSLSSLFQQDLIRVQDPGKGEHKRGRTYLPTWAVLDDAKPTEEPK